MFPTLFFYILTVCGRCFTYHTKSKKKAENQNSFSDLSLIKKTEIFYLYFCYCMYFLDSIILNKILLLGIITCIL